jgi:hypothetical protein
MPTDTPTETEKRLAEVRARRAQAQADRDVASRDAIAAAELAREELAEKDDLAIAAAVEKFGELDVMIRGVKTACGIVIVKRPVAHHFRRFQELPKTKSSDLEQLVRPCLVHPGIADFERYCDEQPATLLRVADSVATLAGVRASEVAGK